MKIGYRLSSVGQPAGASAAPGLKVDTPSRCGLVEPLMTAKGGHRRHAWLRPRSAQAVPADGLF
jgi:hypothetical protein